MPETFTYSFGDALWTVTIDPSSLAVTSTHNVSFHVPLHALERFAIFVTALSLDPHPSSGQRSWPHFKRWLATPSPHDIHTAQVWLRWHTEEGRVCVDKRPFDIDAPTCQELLRALREMYPKAFVGFGDHAFVIQALGLQNRAHLWTALAIMAFILAMTMILFLSRRTDDMPSW